MSDLLVLWDVDGTLLNAGGVGGDLYETVFSSMFGRRCEKLAPMAGRTDRAIILDTLEMAGIPEPRRHVDPFIEGLRSRAPHAFEAARRRGHVLPGAAEAIAAIARVAASTIGFAVPATALPARPVPAAARAAHATAPSPGPAIAAPAAGIPLSVIPAPARTVAGAAAAGATAPGATAISTTATQTTGATTIGATTIGATTAAGTTATAATVPASAFIAATTLPFGSPADQAAVAATIVMSPADGAAPAIAIPPAPAFAPAAPSQRAGFHPARPSRPVQRPPRPDAGRVYQSVLTGNVRSLAEVKLSAVGLRHWLDLCIGAYGDDHEVRTELVHLARRRAGGVHSRDFSGEATIVVGDTPLDVEAALAAGARAVGVATGGYSAKSLRAAGAHAVLADLTNTAAVLSAVLS